jgi:nucleoid-associated protein EbfC
VSEASDTPSPLHGTALAAMLTAMDISPTVALSVLTQSPGRDSEDLPQPAGRRELDVAVSLGLGLLATEPSRPQDRLADILSRLRREGGRDTTGRWEPPMSDDRTGGCLPTSGELIAGLDRLREAMTQVQRDIENVTVHGNSRGNEVTATMQGSGELVDIAIDPDQARRTADDLSGSVTEAVNDALRKLGNVTKARIASLLAAPDSA